MHRCILVLALVLLPTVACIAEDNPSAAGATEEKRITLEFRDEDIKEVINQIATLARSNVIVSPQVVGTVTIKLNNVPWSAALKGIVESLGYRLIEEKHGIHRIVTAANAGEPGTHLPPLPVGRASGLAHYEEFLRDARTETAAKYFIQRIKEVRATGR